MTQEELKVHGSIFYLLKKFIENNYGREMWVTINKEAGTYLTTYDVHENYPASEMFAIVNASQKYTGLSENDTIEKFGQYLVPDLLAIYKSNVDPSWKTFEMLENTESVMHKAVRSDSSKAEPPVLSVSKVNDKLLIIDYYSKRKMASLAIGIIKGIAAFYNETDVVKVVPITNPNDERVQIRVEFK